MADRAWTREEGGSSDSGARRSAAGRGKEARRLPGAMLGWRGYWAGGWRGAGPRGGERGELGCGAGPSGEKGRGGQRADFKKGEEKEEKDSFLFYFFYNFPNPF